MPCHSMMMCFIEDGITVQHSCLEQAVSDFAHLPDVPAVALIEDPLPAIIAVGDGVLVHKLGIKHLFGSLCGHLTDHNWPLEVYLYESTGSTVYAHRR